MQYAADEARDVTGRGSNTKIASVQDGSLKAAQRRTLDHVSGMRSTTEQLNNVLIRLGGPNILHKPVPTSTGRSTLAETMAEPDHPLFMARATEQRIESETRLQREIIDEIVKLIGE